LSRKSTLKTLSLTLAALAFLAGLAVAPFLLAPHFLPQHRVSVLTQNQKTLADLVQSTHCNGDKIHAGIDDIARKAGMTNDDLERLGVAPTSPDGAANCALALGNGLDDLVLFYPVKNCWNLTGTWRYPILPQC